MNIHYVSTHNRVLFVFYLKYVITSKVEFMIYSIRKEDKKFCFFEGFFLFVRIYSEKAHSNHAEIML